MKKDWIRMLVSMVVAFVAYMVLKMLNASEFIQGYWCCFFQANTYWVWNWIDAEKVRS
jgi:hypothetical protein